MLFLSVKDPLVEINFLVWWVNRSSLELVQPMASIASQTDADPLDTPLLGVEVRLADGAVHKIDAAAGYNAMELIRAAGLPIVAECGGAGVCATCHCRVPDAWAKRLPAASDDELAKLDEIPTANDNSRLACQIKFEDSLDGLVLELQPDSLRLALLDAAE
jgi:ferredoxin, 2Fe-2S